MTEARETDFLREVADQADAAVHRLWPSLEQATGDFGLDMMRATPFSDAIDRLGRIAQGARLIIAATRPEGITLPNGEVFRVSLAEAVTVTGTGTVMMGVADQADAAVRRLWFNQEQPTGDFHSDMNRRMPYRNAIANLHNIAQGARLIVAASERGLLLPNGEVFKISLEPPSFLSATAQREQAWMGGELSFPPVEQEGGR